MRLCLISHAYLESAYRHVLEALAEQPGVELAWFTPERYKLNLQTSSGELTERSDRFPTYALPTRLSKRQGTFVYQVQPLRAALDDFKPDIILHEQEVYTLGAGQIAFIAARRKIPLVMFVWENVPRSFSFARRRLIAYVLRNTAGLIAGSSGAATVHRNWGFRGQEIVLPQMGIVIDAEPTYGQRDPAALRVCYVGRLIASKGIDCLLRAVFLQQQQGLAIQCIIAGRGEERSALETLSSHLGIEGIITFAGLLSPEETKALLRSCDVLVLPSRRTRNWEEQFGRVLIEAMAQGTVPVGSRTGAIEEVIGCSDLLFDEDDDVGLAEVLKSLGTDSTRLEFVQREMWHRAKTVYETHVISHQKVAFLQGLRKKHSGPLGEQAN